MDGTRKDRLRNTYIDLFSPPIVTHPLRYAPRPIAEVVAEIKAQKPKVVFAPHVETSSGIILPPAYLEAVSKAVHDVGGHVTPERERENERERERER